MNNDFYISAAKGMKIGQIRIMSGLLVLVARVDGVWLETASGQKLEWIVESNQ